MVSSLFMLCLRGACSGLGLPCYSVRVCGAPQGGHLLVPWALSTAALWRTLTSRICHNSPNGCAVLVVLLLQLQAVSGRWEGLQEGWLEILPGGGSYLARMP